MEGYGPESYGDAFADVYDDWYAGITDADVTVARITELAGADGRVVELGAGTGRLAVPLAQAGLDVTAVDTSATMLDRLALKDPSGTVTVAHGDMVDDLPGGPFDVALVAYNTIFNLLTDERQRGCFRAVAASLRPGGAFVVEAFVPDHDVIAGPAVTVRSMSVEHVVLSVSDHRASDQTASGQFVEVTESGGVRLRPWSIRWSTPAQLDAMAAAAGFTVEHRWADMARTPFDDESSHHVTIYRLGEPAGQNEW